MLILIMKSRTPKSTACPKKYINKLSYPTMSCTNFSRIAMSYPMSVSVSMLLRIKHNYIHINYKKNMYLALQLKIIMYNLSVSMEMIR